MPSKFIFANIKWYSILIVLGIAIAIILASFEEKRKKLPKDIMLDISIAIIPAGIIGARLYYVLFNLRFFLQRPLDIFKIWQGGLAIYGAIIMGIIVSYFICKKRKVAFLSVLDSIVPGLALAQSIGRWGNFFNGEAYGRPVLESSMQFFPYAVYIDGKGYFMATFFYESICTFFIFVYLWLNRKRIIKDGDLFFKYLILYACVRAYIEGFRSDSLYIASFRVSQILSMVIILIVLAYFVFRLQKTNSIISILKTRYFFIATLLLTLALIFAILVKYDISFMLVLLAIIFVTESIYKNIREEKI